MDTAQILNDLRAQRDRTINAIAALEALNGAAISPAKTATKAASHVGINGDKTASVAPASTKRVISPEGRQRMAEAQKKRYAKAKRAVKAAAKKVAVAPVATKSAKTAAVTSHVAKKVGKPMSEATKKKLAVAAKARWAAKSAEKAAIAKA
jgi:hypothetical protein